MLNGTPHIQKGYLFFKAETEQFWEKLNQFEVSTSEIAKEELAETPDDDLRKKLLDLLKQVAMIPVNEEMRNSSQDYLDAGIFTPSMQDDALHVAAAVLTRHDILLSWNFKHLVNRRRRAVINQLNITKGLPTVEIVAPPEV